MTDNIEAVMARVERYAVGLELAAQEDDDAHGVGTEDAIGMRETASDLTRILAEVERLKGERDAAMRRGTEAVYRVSEHAAALAEVARLREGLEVLANSFETGWAGDCDSRFAVIRCAEQMARAILNPKPAEGEAP